MPVGGSDLKLDLIFYRITKLVVKARLNPELLDTLSRALLKRIRVFAEYFENLPFFSEAFLFLNDHSFDRRMRFFLLYPIFDLIDVLAFLGQEIEVGLKVGVNDQDSFIVVGDSP